MQKRKKWKIYAFWIALTELLGALVGFLTRKGTRVYAQTAVKPPLSPPGAVFPIAWTILYALMAIGVARAYLHSDGTQREGAVRIYVLQLAVNLFWSVLFFTAHAYGPAFFWLLLLWVLALVQLLRFKRIDRTAGLLQIPYQLWLTFAAYLNLGAWILNA